MRLQNTHFVLPLVRMPNLLMVLRPSSFYFKVKGAKMSEIPYSVSSAIYSKELPYFDRKNELLWSRYLVIFTHRKAAFPISSQKSSGLVL